MADESADAVTSRAVLAYVSDKPRALQEFHRVLKRGGRLSVAEPVLRDEALEANAMARVIGDDADGSDIMPLIRRWKAAQYPSTDEALASHPLVNYTERQLVAWARGAGFSRVHLELHIDVEPLSETSWQSFVDVAPHPWAPTLGEIMSRQFSASERRRFEEIVRPLVERGGWSGLSTIAYLVAIK